MTTNQSPSRIARRTCESFVSISIAALLTLILPAPVSAATAKGVSVAKAAAREDAANEIEKLMPMIDRALKHPVAQVAGLALRGVTAYQLYVLRHDIADVRQTTLTMLKDIVAIVERIDKGETLNATQWTAAHDRLDNLALRLKEVERRLDGVDEKVREILARLSWRACPAYTKHVGNACVDVRTLPE